jgi:hypothetical protein
LFPSPLATETFKNAHVSSRHAYDVLNDRLDICKIEEDHFMLQEQLAISLLKLENGVLEKLLSFWVIALE